MSAPGYVSTHADREREAAARGLTTCPACDAPKSVGAVVCWGACWRDPRWGLKVSRLSAGAWLHEHALAGRLPYLGPTVPS